MTSLALFILRLTVGGLLAGHGAQKLFGWSGGGGPRGTARYLGSLGIKPAERWAYVAGAAELGGGAITAAGLMNPLGPVALAGSMGVATVTAHKGKPIWVTQGGAELPVTNLAVLAALAIAGPGALSLDSLFGVRVPWWLSFLAMIGTFGMVAAASTPPETRQLPANTERRSAERDTTEEPATSPG
jgi:putative oxidoreductase